MTTGMITAPLNRLVECLKESGIHATADHRDVNPPCAFVAPLRVDEFTLCSPIIVAEVMLVAGDHGAPLALQALEEMLSPALDAMTEAGYDVDDVTLADSVTILPTGHDLPCFTIKTKIY